MSDLKVFDTTVPGILDALRKGEWLVPQFQRDFVWTTDQVSALVQSILEARPIGMVTLWEQEDNPRMPLERVSITDQDATTRAPVLIFFGSGPSPAKQFALLDGRQRCTAIAMAFAGFRAQHGIYRYSGRYFLDVTQPDPRKRVKYVREGDVRRLSLDSDAACFGKGLFPLASNQAGESVLSQWMRYLQALGRPECYPDGQVPTAEEIEKRNVILQAAFEGIVKTKMAVYVVPDRYSLADICDIFETLNTTGTKVSTVDLIHSWLYADTANDPGGPFLLREWINDFGQKDGAIGWASTDDRPELVAQIVTACHVALNQKPAARATSSGGRPEQIVSVKSSDLLATPAEHWRQVRKNEDVLAQSLGLAQKVVADGYFPYSSCPYPAAISVYVGIRWHSLFDPPEAHRWAEPELNALFRAFFWRNALTRRYDQGFLTQIGSDIGALKMILATRPDFTSSGEWAVAAENTLMLLFEYPVPEREMLIDLLTDGNQGGALAKALALPMLAAARRDIIDVSRSLEFPSSNPIELHHIYPKEWTRNNRVGELAEILDPARCGRDYVSSTANLMPLSRQSNNAWRQQFPSQFLSSRNVTYAPNESNFASLFIDEIAFNCLLGGPEKLRDFWDRRANLMADWLVRRTKVTL